MPRRRCSPPTTSTPGWRCPPTRARRRSRSPGARSCAATIPTSPARQPGAGQADQRRPRLVERPGPARRATTANGASASGAPEPARRRRGPTRPTPPGPTGRAVAPRPPVDPSPSSSSGSPPSTRDELDRLAAADPAPIAFGATIRRFLPDDRRIALEVDRGGGRAAPVARGRRATRHPRHDQRLRGRARPRPVPRRPAERAVPGPDPRAADPRLGCGRRPAAVRPERAADPVARRPPPEPGPRRRRGPRGAWRARSAGRRSVAARHLAGRRRGAARLLGARRAGCRGGRCPTPGWIVACSRPARRAAARMAHLLVLRHAFAPATYAALTAPWRPRFLPDEPPVARVRRPPTG